MIRPLREILAFIWEMRSRISPTFRVVRLPWYMVEVVAVDVLLAVLLTVLVELESTLTTLTLNLPSNVSEHPFGGEAMGALGDIEEAAVEVFVAARVVVAGALNLNSRR